MSQLSPQLQPDNCVSLCRFIDSICELAELVDLALLYIVVSLPLDEM